MNQCRTPMAAALLRANLATAGVSPGQVLVTSAGTAAAPGRGATPDAVRVLAARGIDLADHRSQPLAPAVVGAADLILTMTREHLRTVAVEHPGTFGRTFTLKDYVRRARSLGGRRHGEDLPAWLRRLGEGRRPADILGNDPSDDVADPIGQPLAAYEKCVAELEPLIAATTALTFG